MPVIAITREMATLGKDVAIGLAERLGLTVVHHELVEQEIANCAGLRECKRLARYTTQGILELALKGNVLIRDLGATQTARQNRGKAKRRIATVLLVIAALAYASTSVVARVTDDCSPGPGRESPGPTNPNGPSL